MSTGMEPASATSSQVRVRRMFGCTGSVEAQICIEEGKFWLHASVGTENETVLSA